MAEVLLDAVKKGYITASQGYNSKPVVWERLDRMLNPKPNSIKITDSVTGNVTSKIWDQRRNADSIYTYRVREEWNFNYLTNKITIEIKSIMPAETKYFADGKLLGCIDEFAIGYKDFCRALEFDKDLK
jgi:Gliding motility associated protein GldN